MTTILLYFYEVVVFMKLCSFYEVTGLTSKQCQILGQLDWWFSVMVQAAHGGGRDLCDNKAVPKLHHNTRQYRAKNRIKTVGYARP